MTESRQKEWLTDIVESAPSIIFLALWRSGVDMELAGWTGVALAAMTLAGLRLFRVPYNPILLGINMHLLFITPLIVTVYWLGAIEFGGMLVAGSERGVLVTVLAVGVMLTILSPRGFIGVEGLPAAKRIACSSILLLALAAAIVWAFAHTGSTLLAVGLPMMGLFALRRLLIARLLDRAGSSNLGLAIISGPALTDDSAGASS